jgi:hypothetical protein
LEEEGVDDAGEKDGLQVVDDSRSEEDPDSFLQLPMIARVPVADLLRLGAVGASDHKAHAEEAEEGTTWSTLKLCTTAVASRSSNLRCENVPKLKKSGEMTVEA